MATTPYTWAIITIITVLAVQSCQGEKSCTIWSSVGNVVQRGSNLTVYCSFTCRGGTCKKSMRENGIISRHKDLNSSTLYLNVKNITLSRSTYSCRCNNCRPHDPCGMDIVTAFSPDIPDDVKCKCNQIVTHSEVREVVCTWRRGKDTSLWNTSNKLWVRTISGNRIDEPKPYKSTIGGSSCLNASFKVPSSVLEISVWVHANNTLGSVVSTVYNFTITNIVMPSPPVFASAECSSRSCEIKVEQAQMTQYLEMQYRITNQQTWKTFSNATSPLRVQSVSSLEPITQYDFRARSRLSTGLWSQWSKSMTNTTQEEAPKELDVWYCKASSGSSSITVHWKRADASNARGNISGYTVRVHNPNTGNHNDKYLPHPASHHSVESCVSCEVTVFANNSKGQSPPAKVSTLHKNTGEPPQGVHVIVNNGSGAISWKKPETTALHTGYLVEWYPADQKKKELQWVRLGKDNNQVVIPDMKKSECYDGAVYAFYEGSVGRSTFMDVSTSDSVPTGWPLAKADVKGDNTVTVTWSEIPRDQRGGCISNYAIYIRNINDLEDTPPYHVRSSEMMYTVKDLAPDTYALWMTGWNAKGEGPKSPDQIVKIIPPERQTETLVVVIVVILFIMVLLCTIPALRRRFCRILGCCMPDTVPDPANSKWARECSIEKGKLNLLLQLSTSSGSEEEEDEPSTVEVEEVQVESSSSSSSCSSTLGVAATDVSSLLLVPQAGLSPVTTEPQAEVQQYLHTSYIKSYSHESDSSDYTHSSRDTTVDYVSSHRSGIGEEQNEEEDEEEDCMDVMGFFPSDSPFLDSVVCGGKLTLDAVKIDCSDFFHNA